MIKLKQVQGGNQLRKDVDGMATVMAGLADRIAVLERTAITIDDEPEEEQENTGE